MIGFTGTQKGLTVNQTAELCAVLAAYIDLEWMNNGDCIGADYVAGEVWRELGGKIYLRPPDNNSKRAYLQHELSDEPRPYLERNHVIVDNSTVLIACPGESKEKLRSGTWATIRYAKKKGLPIKMILP